MLINKEYERSSVIGQMQVDQNIRDLASVSGCQCLCEGCKFPQSVFEEAAKLPLQQRAEFLVTAERFCQTRREGFKGKSAA